MNGGLSAPPQRTSATGERPNRRDLCRTITQTVETAVRGSQRELLVRLDSANAGEVWSIDAEQAYIGRHPDSRICIDDQGLSRQHARLVRTGSHTVVEDLNSSNGTFVNGARITRCQLHNGDTVQLGPRVCFRFTVAGENEERVLKQLYEASVRDGLTQAYNRHYFSSQLATEIAFAQRHNTELSLLILDVDFFKRINDTLGHLAGDHVLKSLSALLNEQLRKEDVFARYGGEEFVVLLRGVPISGAAVLAERLRRAAETKRLSFGDRSFAITVSIGCAALTCCNRHDPESLIQRADGRLYKAKQDGRNRIVAAD